MAYHIPIVVEVAYGIAHGMGIFADKKGLVKVRGVGLHPLHGWIHHRVEIGVLHPTPRLALGPCALIVDRTRGVEVAGHLIAVAEIPAAAALIA